MGQDRRGDLFFTGFYLWGFAGDRLLMADEQAQMAGYHAQAGDSEGSAPATAASHSLTNNRSQERADVDHDVEQIESSIPTGIFLAIQSVGQRLWAGLVHPSADGDEAEPS